MPQPRILSKPRPIKRKKDKAWLKDLCKQWARGLKIKDDCEEESGGLTEKYGMHNYSVVKHDPWLFRTSYRLPTKRRREIDVCSDLLSEKKQRMDTNSSKVYLDYIFNQYCVGSKVERELLKWKTIQEMSSIVEGLNPVIKLEGYDYPYVSEDGVLVIGGPTKQLKARWEQWRGEWLMRDLRNDESLLGRDVYRNLYSPETYLLRHPYVRIPTAEEQDLIPYGCPDDYPDYEWKDPSPRWGFLDSDWDMAPIETPTVHLSSRLEWNDWDPYAGES